MEVLTGVVTSKIPGVLIVPGKRGLEDAEASVDFILTDGQGRTIHVIAARGYRKSQRGVAAAPGFPMLLVGELTRLDKFNWLMEATHIGLQLTN